MTWLRQHYKMLLLALAIAVLMHACGHRGGELPGGCVMVGTGHQAYEVCR